MGNLVAGLIEFLIEMFVVALALSLVASGISILILRLAEGHKRPTLTVCALIVASILVSAFALDNYADPLEWAYYVLPTLALSALWTMLFLRSRNKT